MPLIYKTFFEVKLLHEFYMTNRDGTSVFEITGQQERLDFLRQQYIDGKDSINSDLSFLFPRHLQSVYSDYHMKILPAFSGFKILVQVNQTIQSDGAILYSP